MDRCPETNSMKHLYPLKNLRYCCKHMWGEPVTPGSIPETDVLVDPPYLGTLFDDCNWLNFMSADDGRGVGDVESRGKNSNFMSKSTCKGDRLAPMFIDARRVKDDMPWQETGELITKVTPT